MRPSLLLRAVLLMLALDAWTSMTRWGGRYGIDGFNVAHWRWLDAIQPTPEAGLYVGIVLLCGLIAFVVALTGAHRMLLAALAVLYTWAWAMSQLDSFQHHYLLSLVLLAFVGFARRDATHGGGTDDTAPMRATAPGDAWAYALVTATCAVTYGWAVVAKLEPAWRRGDVLRRLAAQPLAPFRTAAGAWLGIDEAQFWSLVALVVIASEIAIAVGYVAAPLRDRSTAARVACTAALVAAVTLHLTAEGIGLRIGWFSWYMMVTAVVCFAPAERLLAIAAGPAAAAAFLRRYAAPRATRAALAGIVAAAALATIVALRAIALPGATAVAAIVVTVLAVTAAVAARRGAVAPAIQRSAAAGAGAVAMWLAIAASDVRGVYWRDVARTHEVLGHDAAAQAARAMAEAYAPSVR